MNVREAAIWILKDAGEPLHVKRITRRILAKELDVHLHTLQDEGLVRVESDPDEDKTKIALGDPAKAREALAELPDDLKEDAATIIETYGDLDHNALLRAVYEKYPAYARKSRLKRGKTRN